MCSIGQRRAELRSRSPRQLLVASARWAQREQIFNRESICATYANTAYDKESKIYQHLSLAAVEQAYHEAVQRVSIE
jgi:hypothetical protein